MSDKTFSLFGKDMAYWGLVDDALRNAGITSPQDLKQRLKKPKPDPMTGRIEVRDSKNLDRVLGSIERPHGKAPRMDGGDCWNVAVHRPLSVTPFPTELCDFTTEVSVVRFGFRSVDWKIVLVTDASLELLTKIEHFRLPGETAEQAHVRSMYR